jgi:hypothetical protein
MDGFKNILASRGVWGGIVVILGLLGSFFGFDLDEDSKKVIIDQGVAAGSAVSVAVGAALAIYGRIKASKVIGKAPAEPAE